MTIDLGALLSGQVFGFMLVFARFGTAFMLFPGIGEPYVLSRARLFLALSFTALLLPVVGPMLPAPPANPAETTRLFVIEIIVGVFFGTILRFLLSALEIAGSFISFQIGLSNASLFNPAFATQGSMPGALLSTGAVLLLFLTGMDDMLLAALVNTYDIFKPGVPLIFEDMAGTMAHLVTEVFKMGAQMAVPFFMIVLLMFVPIGVMSRLVPQLQVLIVMLPLQVLIGMALFGLTSSTILMFWSQRFDDSIHMLLLR